MASGKGTAAEYKRARAAERQGKDPTDKPDDGKPDPNDKAKPNAEEERRLAAERKQQRDRGDDGNATPRVSRRAGADTREHGDTPVGDEFERSDDDRDSEGREVPTAVRERKLREETEGADRERQPRAERRRAGRRAERRIRTVTEQRDRSYTENLELRARNEELKRRNDQLEREVQARQPDNRGTDRDAQDPNRQPERRGRVPSDAELGLDARPLAGDFDDPAKFDDALFDWRMKRQDALDKWGKRQNAERVAQDADQRAESARKVAHQAHTERMQARMESDPEFASLVNQRTKANNGVAVTLTQPVYDALAEMEHGDVVHAHLIENPDLADEMASKSFYEQVGAVHVLAEQLSGSEQPKGSDTAPPPRPIRGTTGGAGEYPDNLTDYKAQRARERQAREERGAA